MEEGISLLKQLKDAFGVKEVDIRSYSPLTLAYMGDSIYDVIIRTIVVERANRCANELHKASVKYVNATMQAAIAEAILEQLTAEEMAVYKRGRNAKSYSTAKNASVQDYRKATGLEALFGFLYLTDRIERVIELVKYGVEQLDMDL